jgi:CubicO group peptidase (beta-lactamase class C family)
MKKQTILLIICLGVNLSYGQKTDEQLITAIDKELSQQFKSDEPGATALVARKGQIIYKKAFGMADLELNIPMKADNVFRIGSLTKQFTAVAILQLMEQGKLDLHDEITKFIPDYPTQGSKVTIEHLLTHTSGIQNYTALEDYEAQMMLDLKPTEMIDRFKNKPLRFVPGARWNYSNSNYFLLGYIIEIITGKPYSEYLEEQLLKPAAMTRSLYASDIKLVNGRVGAYSKCDTGYENAKPISMTQPYAAGSILSTVEDLFKWQQAIISYKLIKKESLEKAFTNYKLADGKESNYGFGWRFGSIYDSPSIWHGGGINGFGTMQIYLPKEDVYVVLFTNCDCNHPQEVASKIAALVTGKISEYKETKIPADVLLEYQGVYENAKGQQRIVTANDNKLYLQNGKGPKTDLKHYEKDLFFINSMQTSEFGRNEKRQIEKLTTRNINGNDVWMKTNKPIPGDNGIKVDEKTLASYVGIYEISPEFSFTISKQSDKLFLEAQGQEKIEMFAETETKFFLKVNDAEFVFIKNDVGNVIKTIMRQGGKEAEAKKVK